jgi:hypothetical protein
LHRGSCFFPPFGCLRRLRLFFRFRQRDWRRSALAPRRCSRFRRIQSVVAAQFQRDIFVNGAGVRLLFRDAELGEQVQDLVGLDFQLPRQLVNSDLSHR